VIDLVKRCHKHSTIDVLTARGVLYSRGESYDENRFYSDPGEWARLAEAHRREFLARTDRGVFSLQAEATLNQARGPPAHEPRPVRTFAPVLLSPRVTSCDVKMGAGCPPTPNQVLRRDLVHQSGCGALT
jgi:hypothetical protein